MLTADIQEHMSEPWKDPPGTANVATAITNESKQQAINLLKTTQLKVNAMNLQHHVKCILVLCCNMQVANRANNTWMQE